MRKMEMVALRAAKVSWTQLFELLPELMDSINISQEVSTKDGQIVVRDHGAQGVVVILDDVNLSRRAGQALARKTGEPVHIYEVVGTGGTKGFRFRSAALKATPAGALDPFEGKELDFDDPQETWGGGELETRCHVVLGEFAQLPPGPLQTKSFGYRKRPPGKPSTPRVATLLATLQKAKRHEAVPQDGGRVELRIELAAGGRQTSFCTAAEYDEVAKLLGGKALK